MTGPVWVTVAEVHEITGISRYTIYEMARQGRIPALKVGRSTKFDRRAIEAWMASQPKASA